MVLLGDAKSNAAFKCEINTLSTCARNFFALRGILCYSLSFQFIESHWTDFKASANQIITKSLVECYTFHYASLWIELGEQRDFKINKLFFCFIFSFFSSSSGNLSQKQLTNRNRKYSTEIWNEKWEMKIVKWKTPIGGINIWLI